MNPFADYTRSTAFSLSLSAKMIDLLLQRWTMEDLAERYDWWEPRWGVPTDLIQDAAEQIGGSTARALVRRGLLTYIECDGPDGRGGRRPCIRIGLTDPGTKLAELLRLAEFTSPWRAAGMSAIPPHPDDCDDLGYRPRRKLEWVRIGTEPSTLKDTGYPESWPRDRRLDIWQPGDEEHWEPVSMVDKPELDAMVAAAQSKDEVPADA